MENQPALTSDSVRHILDEATWLFAEHGFNGVTTREIASAVDLSIATVHYHVGTKKELYLQVIRQLFQQEKDQITRVVETAGEVAIQKPAALRDVLFNLVDGVIDLYDTSPARARLYVRRWLDEKDELNSTEVELTLHLFSTLRDLLQRARHAGMIRQDLPTDYFLRSFTWMINDYFITGPLDWQALYSDPHHDQSLQNFKNFFHDYICRMLELSPA